ncbi:MAG: hypothetical protein ACI4PF_06380 [Christensenellales bacterium]
MKAIMISIQPQWVDKILNGEKTIEIRKTMPKCELPCKVYIYCTFGNMKTNYILNKRGKVVAEFILNKVERFYVPYPAYFYQVQTQLEHIVKGSCLPLTPIHHYLKNDTGYAWHIDDLKIYDEPKELSKFKVRCKDYVPFYMNDCDEVCGYYENAQCKNGYIPLTKPFQSWGYAEELGNE